MTSLWQFLRRLSSSRRDYRYGGLRGWWGWVAHATSADADD